MRTSIRAAADRLTAVVVRVRDDERGEVTHWGALAGLASVGTVVMVAAYQDLLVRAMTSVWAGLPGV
ncbi:hypothetical protein GB931_11190 [Modestobacter sp. I12A-02628]|uniref:Uncharacterized protein n=1 Tax=Goekera deserti TaxID=2497753 RepID=A0A7K3WC52_9ACTN|nr:hypothetical protein [Goekera deserti]MPQ98470.1 hypothetical protein [Goekera deserti]NDI48299.1 hypothetical protein [Goekera deserti]NEL54048.1 hypothetical protein [Goekera deserti]